ncbi:MAG: helix-turn-helix domain-containing protein [Prevotellaceae bacterium]|nr:helix-turn-helix domain-containing protein [Prevotellaceae bacterium]
MEDIIIVNHIREYGDMIGAQTLHPLVNVIDFSTLPPIRSISMRRLIGYYAIYIKGHNIRLHYGNGTYEYKEGALVFMAPGQVVGAEDDGEYHKIKGYVLMFHPDLLNGTYLSRLMSRYTYFSYDTNEALSPTDEERALLIDCFKRIETELRRNEEYSIQIVIDHIKLVLDYCLRFYGRQFTARQVQNNDILVRFEQLLNEYWKSELPAKEGLPTVQYCSERLCISTNYFNDLIHKLTGISALKMIHRKMAEVAKEKLADTTKNINGVASELGFQQSQNFISWFKKTEGYTPNKYREMLKS